MCTTKVKDRRRGATLILPGLALRGMAPYYEGSFTCKRAMGILQGLFVYWFDFLTLRGETTQVKDRPRSATLILPLHYMRGATILASINARVLLRARGMNRIEQNTFD